MGYTRPPLPSPVGRLIAEGEKAEIMALTAIVFTSFLLTGITLAVSFFTLRSDVELEPSPLELIFNVDLCVYVCFVFLCRFCNGEAMQKCGWFI